MFHTKYLIYKIFYCLIGILFICPVSVFILFIQLPIFLYRLIVTKLLGPLFQGTLGKAVNLNGQFMATEFLSEIETESKYTILVNIVVEGNVSPNEILQRVVDGWIHAKDGNGALKYPEFHQYLESWMGFMFWKEDKMFNVDNHIYSHELDSTLGFEESENFQCKLVETLLNKPYILKRSPWEIHVVRNLKLKTSKDASENTAILFKLHHALGDGFSITNAIVSGFSGDCMKRVYSSSIQHLSPLSKIKGSSETRSESVVKKITSFLEIFAFPLKSFADFGFVLTLCLYKRQPWGKSRNLKKDEESGKQTPSQLYARSDAISMSELKFIKNTFGVCLSSVFQSCIGAALSKHFNALCKKHDDVNLYMGLPIGGNRDKLRNHTIGTVFNINTSSNAEPVERLRATDSSFKEAKVSTLPRIIYFVSLLTSGSLAFPFSWFIANRRAVPICLTNFPGPTIQFELEGKNAVALNPACSSFASLVFIVCSYAGQVRVSVTADSSLIERSELNQIVIQFCKEIESLYNLAQQKPTPL